MPGTPFSRDHLLGIFDRALAGGDPAYAMRTARNSSPPIEPDRATRLTVALVKRLRAQYDAAARRFVARFAGEAPNMSLRNVAQVADALAVLSIIGNATDGETQEAERGMLRLAEQLEKRREPEPDRLGDHSN